MEEVRLCRKCAGRLPAWDVTYCVYEPERCQICGALVWSVVNVDPQAVADAGIVISEDAPGREE